jgi:tetratricopeptide (TPR) repeat protein
MSHAPRRKYEEKTPDPARPRDTDSAAAVRRLRAILYAGGPGAIIGALGGWYKFSIPGLVIGAALGFGFAYLLTTMLVEGGGSLAQRVYHPSGDTTPHRREYSEAKALELRGLYQEAIDCYASYVAEFPEDPAPCVSIARIYRDHLHRYEDAVTWFKRARQATGAHSGFEALVTREIIELLQGRLAQPQRAIPELARLADRFAGTVEGETARAELARLRRESSGPAA